MEKETERKTVYDEGCGRRDRVIFGGGALYFPDAANSGGQEIGSSAGADGKAETSQAERRSVPGRRRVTSLAADRPPTKMAV